MSTRIRLKRMGNTHRPYYRVTVVDQRKKRDGRVLEQLGTYDPLLSDDSKQISLVLPRCAYWLSVGAQPTDTVATLFRRAGLKSVSGTAIADQPAELIAVAEGSQA